MMISLVYTNVYTIKFILYQMIVILKVYYINC